MSLSESGRRPTPNYPHAILERLFREQVTAGRADVSYLALCDRLAVPSALRGVLLLALLNFDYVSLDGDDAAYLTEARRRLAAAPLN